jgi:PAS domain S-box-containing protein
MLDGHESSGIQADEPLGRADGLTNAVLDTVGALVVVLDPAGQIVRFNRACERTTGYRFAEVEGRPFWDFLLIPEEVEPVKAVFAQLQTGEIPNAFENYWVAKDGSRHWIAWSNTALPGESGSIQFVIGTGIDITEHRRAEDELQRALDESRQRQAEVSALLNGARQVLAQHRFEETARSIFDTCKDLTGATAGYLALSSQDGTENELLFLESGGRPCTIDPALPMPIRGLRGQVYQSGSVAYENDFWSSPWAHLLPAGHVGVDNLLFAPLVISGQVVGLLGLANKPGGFTENDARLATAFAELASIALHNSRLMESLEASELRFRSVVETASAAIVTADNRGKITFCNRAAETIFGYTAEEMIGAPLTQIMPERFWAAHRAGMHRVLVTGKTRLAGETVETIGARKNGNEFPLELSLAAWQTGEGSFFTALMHETTQRKQFEEALREAKQAVETLIQASPLAITAFDLDLTVRLWNPAAERIFGWSEGEVLGRPYPLIPETKQEEFQGMLAQALAGQTMSGRETVRHKKDGSPIDVSIWNAPLYDADGKTRNIMAIIADITERRQAEEALRLYAREQTALYTVTSAVTATLDQDELLPVVLDAVLPALEADAGWILLPGPLPGDPLHVAAQRGISEELLTGELILAAQDCPVYQVLSRGEGGLVARHPIVDCPALAATGKGRSELQSLVCVPLSVGQEAIGLLKIGWRQPNAHLEQDLGLLLSVGRQVGVALHNAQLYQAARQVNRLRVLSELDRKLAATLEVRRLAEVTLHEVATHLDARAASILLLVPTTQEQPMMKLFSPAQGWREILVASQEATHWHGLLDRVKDQQEPAPLTTQGLELGNQARELAQSEDAHGLLVPIWGEDALLALLVLGGRRSDRPFADEDWVLAQIAARHAGQAMQNAQLYEEVRRLLHEQEQTRAQLIQIEKLSALGRLAATMAHEINNPLQAVQNSLTLIEEEMDSSQRRDKVDRYLEVAAGEVERISAIVRRMRDYYRPTHERLQPTDLLAVLDSVLELSGKELQHHHVMVERLGSSDLPMVQANPDHLKQVFLNLVLNAVDSMPTGGTLRVFASQDQIRPEGALRPQPAVRIEISDTGHGMPPETLARLFEPFFTTKEQGAGLGLSISYSIIEAHNGQITVTSEVGSGTTFCIFLPVTLS